MSDIARKRFHGWRFDKRNPRDVELAEWVQNDIDSGRINVGEVCKDLLYAYYVYVRGKGEYVGGGTLFLGLFREMLENSLEEMLSSFKLAAPKAPEEEEEKPKPTNTDRAKDMFKFTASNADAWNA